MIHRRRSQAFESFILRMTDPPRCCSNPGFSNLEACGRDCTVRERNEYLRTKILEEAIGMVAREGVSHTTMRALARRLGISPATLYQHFRNKQHLQREIALHGIERLHEAMSPAADIEDPFEALREMSLRYIQFGLSNPELYQLMYQTLGSLRDLGLVDDPRVLEYRSRVASVYERGMAAGVFRGVDPNLEISVRWAAVHGFVQLVAARRLPDVHARAELRELKEATIEMMLRSLRP
jgi:AcrR family transcriptional regulator